MTALYSQPQPSESPGGFGHCAEFLQVSFGIFAVIVKLYVAKEDGKICSRQHVHKFYGYIGQVPEEHQAGNGKVSDLFGF